MRAHRNTASTSTISGLKSPTPHSSGEDSAVKPGTSHQDDKPRVAHFIRGWLLPAQTFIGNQICSLKHHHALAFSHHRLNASHPFKSTKASALIEDMTPFQQKIERLAYRFFRAMTPLATQHTVRALRQASVRLLHFHFLVDARFFLPVIRAASLPTVISAYGYDVSSFPKKGFGVGLQYLRPLFKENVVILAMSENMRQDILQLGCPQSRVLVHYYGTEVEKFSFPGRVYRTTEELHLLVCGRLVAKKGHKSLLRALHLIDQRKSTGVRLTTTIVGEGPCMNELQALAGELGLKDRVIFRGHLPHEDQSLVDAYRKADVFALPSITVNNEKEGIPGTLIEAMASGLPVISTRHAGIPEVVEHDVTGILVDEGHVEQLADAIVRLATDAAERRRLGQAAALRASRDLALHQKTQNIEALYSRLINGQPATVNSRSMMDIQKS